MAEVKVVDLCKNFGSVIAVNHVNIDVRDGEFMCMLGPSGCGKTTTLRSIAGLETPTSGDIFIGDRNVTWMEPKERDIAMVFESYALYPHMTVAQNIGYPLKIRGLSKADIEKAVLEVAKMLQMESMFNRYPKQLSGGQRQRVAIGRAIVRKPAVYLMDEPISHLDAKLRAHMRGELKRLQKDLGRTTIYVTHDQLEAMAMADRVGVMRLGVLQQLTTPDELYNNPVNMYVAGFIGDPPDQFPDGRTGARGGEEDNCLIGADFTVPLSASWSISSTPTSMGKSCARYPAGAHAVHTETPEGIQFDRDGLRLRATGRPSHRECPAGHRDHQDPDAVGTKVDVGQPVWLTFDEKFVQFSIRKQRSPCRSATITLDKEVRLSFAGTRPISEGDLLWT